LIPPCIKNKFTPFGIELHAGKEIVDAARIAIYDNYMATLAYWNVFFLILAQFFLLTKTKFYEKSSAMDECDESECFY